MDLSTYDINLKVLRAGYYDSYQFDSEIKKTQERICYDYELEYYLRSDGAIICDGETIPFASGEVNVRKPGQRVCGIIPYTCYIICFHVNGGKQTDGYAFGDAEHAQPNYRNALLNMLPNKICVQDDTYVRRLFEELLFFYRQQDDFSIFRANQLLYELIGEMLRQVLEKQKPFSNTHPRIVQIVHQMQQDFSEHYQIDQLIAESGLCKAHFHKCFKAYTGRTPLEYLLYLRMENAKELLSITEQSISDIAVLCGYDDPVYFSYLFKRETKQTPSQYRKSTQTRWILPLVSENIK